MAGLAAALLAPAAPAAAAGPVFSIIPTDRRPYFVYRAAPGAVIHGTVKVTNVSTVAGTVRLSGVDATTGQTSGAVYLSSTATQHAVGTWLSLASNAVKLAPHSSQMVPFTVRVPSSASAGEHLGGLVAAPAVASQVHTVSHGGSSFHVNINEISIVAVQVNVPGPHDPRLDVTGITAAGRPGYQTLLLTVANTGNELLKAQGRLQITQASGGSVLNRAFKLDTLVPQTSIQYPVYVTGQRLAPGQYRAKVRVVYPKRPPLVRTFSLTISNGQVRQTYGSQAPLSLGGGPGRSGGPGSPGGSGTPVWLLVLGGVALVALGVGGSTALQRGRSKPRD